MKRFKKIFNIIIDIIIYIVIVVMGTISVLIVEKINNQVFNNFRVIFLNWKNGLNFNNKNFLINDVTFSIIYFVIDVIVCFSFGIIWIWLMNTFVNFLNNLKFKL